MLTAANRQVDLSCRTAVLACHGKSAEAPGTPTAALTSVHTQPKTGRGEKLASRLDHDQLAAVSRDQRRCCVGNEAARIAARQRHARGDAPVARVQGEQ